MISQHSNLEKRLCAIDAVELQKGGKNQYACSITKSIKSGLDDYFRPKSFEKSGKFYTALGVKEFHRFYLATIADLIIGNRKFLSGFSSKSLESMKVRTCVFEAIHFIGNLIMIPIISSELTNHNYKSAVFGTVLNVVVNIYPIMLQRYNRARIYNILEKIESKKNACPVKLTDRITDNQTFS